MKNISSESIVKLNQLADVFVVKKFKICITKQLKWGRIEKKPYNFELIGKL